MKLCSKRKSCIAKGICAINITPDTYNCKQFHKALKEKITSPNNRSTKFPRNCCGCPVELDDLDGCDLQYGSGNCRRRVAQEHRAVR